MKAKVHYVGFVLLLVLAFAVACNQGDAPILPSSSQDPMGIGATGSFIAAPVAQSVPSFLAFINLPSVADIVEATRPSVVNVTAQTESGNPVFRSRCVTSTGPGATVHSGG